MAWTSSEYGARAVSQFDWTCSGQSMSKLSEPFWGWPGWKHLRFAAVVSLIGTIWFAIIYGGCDAITANRATWIRIHLDSELNLPFIPDMVVFYMSIYLLFLAAPFILRTRREFLSLAIMLDVIILIGGIGFVLIPAQLAFVPPTDLGHFPGLFRFADRLNLTYNLVPSLHVALSVLCIGVFATRSGLFGKILLWSWAIAITVSTLLTHQHHILDAASGWLVALVSLAFWKREAQTARAMALQKVQESKAQSLQEVSPS
jgi:hypothetical protein